MIKSFKITYIVLLFSFASTQYSYSQTCGFGCLGLSGINVGYSFEQYDAKGLNLYLNNQLQEIGIDDQHYNFKNGMGFKFGMTIVRANFDSYFFSVKGYYQFLSEEQTINAIPLSNEELNFKSKFEMNHWALGFDFGIPVFEFVDWKIVDGSIKFFDTKLINKVIANGTTVEENKFEMPKVTVGYAVGTGFVIHILKDYISLEGSGMYNFTQIANLTNNQINEQIPEKGASTDIVVGGGLSAQIQLNIGIPL